MLLFSINVLGLGSGLSISLSGSISASKLLYGSLSVAIILVFSVIDIVNLVKDWNKKHPTVDVINQLIEDLQKDLKFIKELDNSIASAFNFN